MARFLCWGALKLSASNDFHLSISPPASVLIEYKIFPQPLAAASCCCRQLQDALSCIILYSTVLYCTVLYRRGKPLASNQALEKVWGQSDDPHGFLVRDPMPPRIFCSRRNLSPLPNFSPLILRVLFVSMTSLPRIPPPTSRFFQKFGGKVKFACP